VTSKDQRLCDGIVLTSAAYEAGQLEALEWAKEAARRAHPDDDGLVADLEARIVEIKAGRTQS
jgi:hypothetical protein